MDLQKIIDEIKEGYTIEEYEEDGCDDCGSLYWVFCKNGWSGRDWNLDTHLKKDIKAAEKLYYINKNKRKNNIVNDTNEYPNKKCNYKSDLEK